MTTITSTKPNTKSVVFKKNQTGFFATNTVHELKPARNHVVTGPTLSPQFRHNSLSSLLFASSEQKQHRLAKHEIEQYDPLNENPTNESFDHSRSSLNNRLNGFPPSIVRHQKPPSKTTTSQRNSKTSYEQKDSPPKSAMFQTRATARLKSEIDYLHHQLKRQEVISQSLSVRDNRDFDGALCYSTSCRLPSASTILTADRIHKRFSSAATHCTANTFLTIPVINDASTQTMPILSDIVTSIAPAITKTDENQQDTKDYGPTHAYQIPQQSNVGSESVFLTDSSVFSSSKIRTTKHHDLKSIACPFYMIYFTNLAMQQGQLKNNHNEKEMILSTKRRMPINSLTSTAISRHQSTRRQVNSALSLNTYLTIDDNVYVPNSIPSSQHKHPSARTDNENSSTLRDVLRTSSWNRVKV